MSNLKVVKFNAAMSCSGCAGAITRILSKIDGMVQILSLYYIQDVINYGSSRLF